MEQREQTPTKDQIAERLAAYADELRALGVRSLDLFGSIARGDVRPESDVDLLVEFEEIPGSLDTCACETGSRRSSVAASTW